MGLLQILGKRANLKNAFITNKQIIEQIHSEFNNAGEELLKEANAILESTKFSSEKADKLSSIGFINVPEVKKVEEKKKAVKTSSETIELVQGYKLKYPNYKFITDPMVKEICEKYNLVCGDISLYKGFVPLHNLNQIETFLNKYTFNIWEYNNGSEDRTIKHCDMSEFEIKISKHGLSYYHFYKKGVEDEHSFQSENGFEFYGTGKINGKSVWHSNMIKCSMKICAPVKEMDTTGMKLEGHMLTKHIPDPVILQPVMGGYLIVTAWGEESSDPLVVNESNN